MIREESAATDGVHDLDSVPGIELTFGVATAWDDLSIDFYRHSLVAVAAGFKQFFQAQHVGNFLRLAIQCDLHRTILARPNHEYSW